MASPNSSTSDASAPTPLAVVSSPMSPVHQSARPMDHVHEQDTSTLAEEIPAGDVLSSATKALPLQPSDATVPLVDISGRHQTPTEMLQLPCYDKSQPTLLGIPKEIRLQILKLALPHTTEVVVCTDIDPRGKHFLEYRALQSPTVIPWGTATQDNFVPGSPLPSFLRTSKQLYDEGSELMEGFKTYILNGRPAHFERYPAVLQKHTKTIYFAPWAICADYAFLHANFPQLREIEFFVPLPEMPDYMQVTLTEQAAVASAASATEAPGAASYLYLESPIPNPDESDFTQRILPRFQYQGQHFCDRFYDAVYKNNIKITWDSFVGQFEPSRTGSTHKVAKFMAVARFTWSEEGINLVFWLDFEETGRFERTCIEGRGNLKGVQPLTSQPCGSVSCKGNCAGCVEPDRTFLHIS